MKEEKAKINCLIPASIIEKIKHSKYSTVTEATTEALQRLMNEDKSGIKSCSNEIEQSRIIKEFQQEIILLQRELIQAKDDVIQLLKTRSG